MNQVDVLNYYNNGSNHTPAAAGTFNPQSSFFSQPSPGPQHYPQNSYASDPQARFLEQQRRQHDASVNYGNMNGGNNGLMHAGFQQQRNASGKCPVTLNHKIEKPVYSRRIPSRRVMELIMCLLQLDHSRLLHCRSPCPRRRVHLGLAFRLALTQRLPVSTSRPVHRRRACRRINKGTPWRRLQHRKPPPPLTVCKVLPAPQRTRQLHSHSLHRLLHRKRARRKESGSCWRSTWSYCRRCRICRHRVKAAHRTHKRRNT